MKFKFALTLVMFTLHIPFAFTQPEMVPTVTAMSDGQVWDALVSVDNTGATVFGQCKVAVANQCSGCACPSYFQANIAGSLGYKGWPKNPLSGDSTGCLGKCGGGYLATMCTADLKTNAKAMLLDALSKDACGPQTDYVAKTGSTTVFDSSRFVFVDPKAPCAKDKARCALVGIADNVGSVTQFSPVSKNICQAAYVLAQKMQPTQIKLISCEEFNSKIATNASIQQAASAVGQLNLTYSLFNLNGMQPFLDSIESQYKVMSSEQVALFYVAVNKDVSKLPAILRERVDPKKFENSRGLGEKYIVNYEINQAEDQLRKLTPNIVLGSKLDVAQAMEQLKKIKE
jgi:hypothetical protein